MYKGTTQCDAAYYFCPYRPGMSDEEVEAVNNKLSIVHTTTELQHQIMDLVRTRPQQ